jgi:phage baseplate assembly protein W
MATDFGTDVLCFPGLDETFSLASGGRVVAEALARRLSTPRGSLPFHPDYGLDVRAWLNDAISQDLLYRLKASAERECEQDERVEAVEVAVTYVQATQALRLRVTATTAQGPFRFTLSVSQVSIDLLAEE